MHVSLVVGRRTLLAKKWEKKWIDSQAFNRRLQRPKIANHSDNYDPTVLWISIVAAMSSDAGLR